MRCALRIGGQGKGDRDRQAAADRDRKGRVGLRIGADGGGHGAIGQDAARCGVDGPGGRLGVGHGDSLAIDRRAGRHPPGITGRRVGIDRAAQDGRVALLLDKPAQGFGHRKGVAKAVAQVGETAIGQLPIGTALGRDQPRGQRSQAGQHVVGLDVVQPLQLAQFARHRRSQAVGQVSVGQLDVPVGGTGEQITPAARQRRRLQRQGSAEALARLPRIGPLDKKEVSRGRIGPLLRRNLAIVVGIDQVDGDVVVQGQVLVTHLDLGKAEQVPEGLDRPAGRHAEVKGRRLGQGKGRVSPAVILEVELGGELEGGCEPAAAQIEGNRVGDARPWFLDPLVEVGHRQAVGPAGGEGKTEIGHAAGGSRRHVGERQVHAVIVPAEVYDQPVGQIVQIAAEAGQPVGQRIAKQAVQAQRLVVAGAHRGEGDRFAQGVEKSHLVQLVSKAGDTLGNGLRTVSGVGGRRANSHARQLQAHRQHNHQSQSTPHLCLL